MRASRAETTVIGAYELGFVLCAWFGFGCALACRLAMVAGRVGEWRAIDFGVDELA